MMIDHRSGGLGRAPSFLGNVYARSEGNGGKSYATLRVMQGGDSTLTLYATNPDELFQLAEEATALAHKLQKQLNADAAADAVLTADDAREMAEATL
jgi:hypothetical protein